MGVHWIFILAAPAASIVANTGDFPWPLKAKSVQDAKSVQAESSAWRQLEDVKTKLKEANEQLVKDGQQFEQDAEAQRKLMGQVGQLKTERERAVQEKEQAVTSVAAEKNRTIESLVWEKKQLQDSVAKLQGQAAKSAAEEQQQLEALRNQQQISAANEAARFKAAIANQVAMKLNMSQYASEVIQLKDEKHELERAVRNLTDQNLRTQHDLAGKLEAQGRESQAQVSRLMGENKRLQAESAMMKKGTEQFAMHEKSAHESQAQSLVQTIQKLKAENSDLLQAKSRLEAQEVFLQDKVRKMATGDAQAKAAGEAWRTSAEVELTNLRKEKEGLSTAMQKMMKESALGKAHIEELEKMAYAAKASEKDLQDKLQKMAADGARVTGAAAQTTKALKASAEAQAKQLRAENEALSARMQQLMAESDKQKEQLADLQRQGLEAQAANASMGSELMRLRSDKQSLYDEMQQLLNESDRQKERIGELEQTALETKAASATMQKDTEELAMHEKSVHESQAETGLHEASLTGISSERQALYKSWQDGANKYQEEESRLMQQLINAVEANQAGGGAVEVGLLKRLMEKKQQLHKEQQEHLEKSQEQEATLSRQLQEVLAQTYADKENYRKSLMEKTTAMVYDTARWKSDAERLSGENLDLKAELLKVTTEKEHLKEKNHALKERSGLMTTKSVQKSNAEKTTNPIGAALSSLFTKQSPPKVSEEEHKLGEVVKKWRSEHNHPKEAKAPGAAATEDWINDAHSMHSKEAKASEVRSREGDLFTELVDGLNKMRSEKRLLETQLESDQMTIRTLQMKCGESSTLSPFSLSGTSTSASPASEHPTSPPLEVSKKSVDSTASAGKSQYQPPSGLIPGTNVPLEIGTARQKSVQQNSVPTPAMLLGAREGTTAHDIFKELMEQIAKLQEALKDKDKTCFNHTVDHLDEIKALKAENERLVQKSKAANWEHVHVACEEMSRKEVKGLEQRVEDLRQEVTECNRQRASLSVEAGRRKAQENSENKTHLEAVESNLKDCYGTVQRMHEEEGNWQACRDELKQKNTAVAKCLESEAALGNELKQLQRKMDPVTGDPSQAQLAGMKDIIRRLEDENYEMKDVRSKLQECEHKEKESEFTIKQIHNDPEGYCKKHREDLVKAVKALSDAKEDFEKKLGQATRDNQQHTRELVACTEKSQKLDDAYRNLTGQLASGKGSFAQLNIFNQQIKTLQKELKTSGEQKDDCERRYKLAIENLASEELHKKIEETEAEKARLQRKMIQVEVESQNVRSNASQLALYNQELHEDNERLKKDIRMKVQSLSDCKELASSFVRAPPTPRPAMGVLPIARPAMGVPPMARPPVGVPPMAKPPMGLPPMAKLPMGVPPMGVPPMARPRMRMPSMVSQILPHSFTNVGPEEDGPMRKQSVDADAVKQPAEEVDEAKELMAEAEKLKAAIAHAVEG